MRLLTFALVVAAAAADDSKNETLDEGYSLEGLQLNLSTCDLFIVALAMAENSPLIDSFEAGPAETLRQEPHLARCAVGADSPLTGPGPGHLAASPMLVAGTTPVFTAIMAGQADWLAAILDAGGDPNTRRADDALPLLVAANFGRPVETQLLVDAGADVEAAAGDMTALETAAELGQSEVVAVLVAAAESRLSLMRRRTMFGSALNFAAKAGGGFEAYAAALEAQGHIVDQRPREVEAYVKVVEILVGAGMSPDHLAVGTKAAANNQEGPPLVTAAHYGRTPLVKRLLELGADPNAAERTQGMTALISLTAHVDDEDTFLDIAKLLLLAGADCDRATTPHGGTAAIYAVLDRKYTALGALGLSGRCDMDKADAGGKTPADWARRSNDENALLVLREAKPETAYGRNIFQAKPEKPEP